MTPHDSPNLPGPWPDVLAALADGELDPAARAVVELWLAGHPGALAELQAQRHFSPDNWPMWQQAEPPLPSAAAWNTVREAVHLGLVAPVSRPVSSDTGLETGATKTNRWVRTSAYFARGIAAAIAAIVLIASATGGNPPIDPQPESGSSSDPLAE